MLTRLAALSFASIPVAFAWTRGGAYAPWQSVAVIAAIAALALAFAAAGRNESSSSPFHFLLDPAVALGFCFICLLLIQWLNGGRALVFDGATGRWCYAAPPAPWLPSSFNRAEAFEIIAWFFPAWCMLAVARGVRFERSHALLILYIVIVSAACLGLLGIAQFVTRTKAIFWRFPIDAVFFATFGYANHAGIYFLLAGMLAMALLVYEVESHRLTAPPAGRTGLLAVTLVICAISVHLSYSRGAILLLWCSAAVTVATVLRRLWPRLWPSQRVNSIAMLIAVAGLGAGAAIVFGGRDLGVEIGSLARFQSWAWFAPDSDRRLIAQAALDTWRESPFWGVGGWGFPYCLGQHLPPERWSVITAGKANVHNDALQFLCEFGVMGLGLQLVVSALLLRPWLALLRSRSAAGIPIVAGSIVLLLFALVDLPFRSPAIIALWLAMVLGGLPLLAPPVEGTGPISGSIRESIRELPSPTRHANLDCSSVERLGSS